MDISNWNSEPSSRNRQETQFPSLLSESSEITLLVLFSARVDRADGLKGCTSGADVLAYRGPSGSDQDGVNRVSLWKT